MSKTIKTRNVVKNIKALDKREAAVTAAKTAAKGTAAFAKMAIAAVKSLAAVIAAGGWVAVAVILIICLVGLIAASAFGIYAVRTATDPDEPLDAVTMDDRRQQLLRGIYWDMNSISYRVEGRQFEEIVAVEQADGTIVMVELRQRYSLSDTVMHRLSSSSSR